MKPIDAMYAWVSEDGAEGERSEGVVACMINGVMMPLVGADRHRAEACRKFAQMTARLSGRPVKLVSFSTRVEIDTVYPR